MSIKVWPVKERPREKLLYYGAEYLSDAELIAVMLGAGVAGKTALGLARDLLDLYEVWLRQTKPNLPM